MMHPVKSPSHNSEYGARLSDCIDALEGRIQQLFEEAFRAGWKQPEVVEALKNIVERHAAIVSGHADNSTL